MSLFTIARKVSRLWLPPLLENLAALVPAICDADGCSIFLLWNERLHLAATTRQNQKPRLFDRALSYAATPELLSAAATYYREHNVVNLDGGLTGWVAAFDRELNLKNLRDEQERQDIADSLKLPLPLWSDRLRGHFDWEGTRPFLAVPMRHADKGVCGVIRAYSIRANPRPFTDAHCRKLIEFGQALAAFLVTHNLLETGLEEYFRLWAARDGHEFGRQLTGAVPRLFNMDCCTFFARDDEDRFVLRYASAAPNLPDDDRRHFDLFFAESRDRLYYDAKVDSKTSLCIKQQRALLLRHSDGKWEIMGESDSSSRESLQRESNPQFLDAHPRDVKCELDPAHSRSILLVPVRDAINPRKLSGVLRVVSAKPDSASESALAELQQFAAPLAERLGHTLRQDVERDVCQRLIDQIREFPATSSDSNWHMAARIAGKALGADAVTIFLTEGDRLRSKPSYTFLNEDQIRMDQPLDVQDAIKREHQAFTYTLLPQLSYGIGEGCTGWAARERRVLNLRNSDDEAELRAYGIRHPFPQTFGEIQHAGPFIAAPISLGPGETVDGVVRGVRCRSSSQGPFSVSHELILSAFATMLAGVSRVWRPLAPLEPPVRRLVISYSNAQVKDELCRFLAAIDVEGLHLGVTPTGNDVSSAFEEIMRRAAGAIVIATPRGVDGSISVNVENEIGQLLSRFPNRLLLLKDRHAVISALGRGLPTIEFSDEGGLAKTFTQVAFHVREWFAPGSSLRVLSH